MKSQSTLPPAAYSPPQPDIARRRRLFRPLVCFAFAAAGMVLFFLQTKKGLLLFEWDDEMAEVVTAQMIAQGKHLYRDIFASHGPLPFMIAHFYVSVVKLADFSYIRLTLPLLAALSCVALACSAAVKTLSGRLWTGATYLLLLSFAWNPNGFNMLVYDTLPAYFFVIIITQLVLPFILCEEPPPQGVFASGCAATLVCFCANTNGVAAIFLVLSPIPSILSTSDPRLAAHAKAFLLGVLSALLAVVLWLIEFGDLVGYVIYHFYYNLKVYRKYIGFSPTDVLRNFSSLNHSSIHRFVLFLFLCWFTIFFVLIRDSITRTRTHRLMSLILLGIGVLFTNFMGRGGYTESSFIAVNAALFAAGTGIALERAADRGSKFAKAVSVFLCLGVMVIAREVGASAGLWTGAPATETDQYTVSMKPESDPFYDFVRSLTRKEGDFLVLDFHPGLYVKTDRLPASGNLYYFTMQADYYRNPIWGYKIDICADIRARRPAVIWFFNWRMWGLYSIDEYEPCILSLISEGYTAMSPGSPWLLRNDLFKEAMDKLPRGANTQLILPPGFVALSPDSLRIMQRSALLTPTSPIQIKMSPTHENHPVALQRIGVMLATYGQQHIGAAELHLLGSDGAEFVHRLALEDIMDGKYAYVDIDARRYSKGEIRSLSGGGISTWESHMAEYSYTCLIYEYVDGSKRYTPQCPIM